MPRESGVDIVWKQRGCHVKAAWMPFGSNFGALRIGIRARPGEKLSFGAEIGEITAKSIDLNNEAVGEE